MTEAAKNTEKEIGEDPVDPVDPTEPDSFPEYPESDEATTQEDLDRERERRESDYLVHLPIDDDEDDDDPIVTNRNKPRIKSQVFKPGVQDFEQTIRDSVGG